MLDIIFLLRALGLWSYLPIVLIFFAAYYILKGIKLIFKIIFYLLVAGIVYYLFSDQIHALIQTLLANIK